MSNLILKPVFDYSQRIAKRVFEKIPSVVLKCGKDGKILNGIKWTGQHISSPQNRLILGATALMSQPFIDLYNRNVDEETRKVSVARTVAKIIAGTATGFGVRYGVIKLVDIFTREPKAGQKGYETLFMPVLEGTIKGLKKYKLALGTFISLAVMLYTNFAVDAPLTKYLTNIFVKRINEHDKRKFEKGIIKDPSKIQSANEKTKIQNITYIQRPTIDSFTKRKEVYNV